MAAVKMKTTVKLRASAECPSHSLAEVSVRDLTFAIDEPVERGGTNNGPTPTDTALAALIGCTNVIGHKCADKLGVDIGNLGFAMEIDFDRRGVLLMEEVEVPFKAIRLSVTADGPASAEELDAVARETARFCAISKLYENSGTQVTVTWTKA